MSKTISNIEKQCSEYLQTKTGLKVSYKYLSPSILSSLNVNKIEITDCESGKKIAEIRKAVLSYDVFEFFSKNPLDALENLTITGVNIEYNSITDERILKKIGDLFESDETEEQTVSDYSSDFHLPFDVIAKDISIHYSDDTQDVLLKMNQLSLSDSNSFKNEIAYKFSGKVFYQTEYFKNKNKREVFASNLEVDGKVFPKLLESSATVHLSKINNVDYSVSDVSLFAYYSKDKLQLRTMRTILPFNFFAEYNLNTDSIHFDMVSNNFNPLKFVLIKNKTGLLKSISGSTISGSVSIDYDFNKDSILYKTDSTINFSSELIGEKFRVICKANGNEKRANFSKLDVLGKSFSGNFVGKFYIKNLQPDGVLTLVYYMLPNGSILSTEAFVEPYEKGFKCFAPQFFMNSKSLTGLELAVIPKTDSFDFTVDFYDYSHSEDDFVGNVNIDGSFIFGKTKFIQTHAIISNIFTDSIFDFTMFFINQNDIQKYENIRNNILPYVVTSEAFLSSDFNDFSCNLPYGVIANSKKDDELLTFSIDGSKQFFQINQLDLQYGNYSVQASASVDFSLGFDNFAFNTNLFVNSLPYNFSGNYTDNWLSLSGDYSFDSMIHFSDDINGFFQFKSFPVAFNDYIFSFSTMSTFSYSEEKGINIVFANFEASEATDLISISPKIVFSGELTNTGLTFNTFSYFDNFSELDINGGISWEIRKNIIDWFSVQLYGQNFISSEKIDISADLVNIEHIPFAIENVINDYYLSASIKTEGFAVSRILSNQKITDVIDAEINATGTIKNPFLSVNLKKALFTLSDNQFSVNGYLLLNDNELSFSNINCSWFDIDMSNFNGNLDLKTFIGNAHTDVHLPLFSKETYIPLEFSVSGAVDSDTDMFFQIPDFLSISVKSSGIVGDVFKQNLPFAFNIVHIPGQFDIFSNDPKGFKVSIIDNYITATTGKNPIIQFNLEGDIGENGKIDFFLTGVESNIAKIFEYVNIPFLSVSSGMLSGDIRVSGLINEPEFAGVIEINKVDFNVPFISKYSIKTNNIQITADSENLNIPNTVFSCGKSSFLASSDITFDRWFVDAVYLRLKSFGKKGFPFEVDLPNLRAKGEATADIELSLLLPSDISVKGTIVAENSDIDVIANDFQKQLTLEGFLSMIPNGVENFSKLLKFNSDEEKVDMKVNNESSVELNLITDLKFIVGKKFRLAFNPFLRGLVTPNTPIYLKMDSSSNEFFINGDISLHGGEVSWLNRNFYLREGRIVLNETQDDFDPHITLRAETRERDESGNRITISLSAENQLLSEFNPIFSATPAKSESEIMALLGQVITADSENISSFFVASGDYLVQNTIGRKIENTLREMCNFDIFSLRTNIIQNAMKQGLDGTGKKSEKYVEKDNKISFSNFFDNSTVYIGKYFGSDIYVDTMLNMVYDKTKIDEAGTVNGLVFQPEFGFELASPFVNIRLGIAPTIDAIKQNQWVSSSSITLSWKHSF